MGATLAAVGRRRVEQFRIAERLIARGIAAIKS